MTSQDTRLISQRTFEAVNNRLNGRIPDEKNDADVDAFWTWILGSTEGQECLDDLAHLREYAEDLFESVMERIKPPFLHRRPKGWGVLEKNINARIDTINKERDERDLRSKGILADDFDFGSLERTKSGVIHATVLNLSLVLKSLRDIRVVYDDFSADPYLTLMPWDDKPLRLGDQNYYPLNEINKAKLMSYLGQHVFRQEVMFKMLLPGIIDAGTANRINIYQRWMNSKRGWDGEDRMGLLPSGANETNFNQDTYASSWRRCWLIRYLKVRCDTLDDVKWALIVARKFFIAMVQRCYDPGCIMKFCLVLEGEQEIGKTPWIMSLAPCPELYVSVDMHDAKAQGTNSFSRKVVGHTVCEFEEARGINYQSDADLAKKVISMQADHYDPKFRPHVWVPRSCVFVISTNKMSDLLNDPTGLTRFYPVRSTATRKDPIDRDGFSAIYDQLLAQAIMLHENGETAQLNDQEQDLQKVETDKRQWVCDEQEWVDEYFGSNVGSTHEGKALTNFDVAKDRGWAFWEDVTKYQMSANVWSEKKDFDKHKRRINESFKKWGFTITRTAIYENGRRVKAYWYDGKGASGCNNAVIGAHHNVSDDAAGRQQ